jgi:hypothetical protein
LEHNIEEKERKKKEKRTKDKNRQTEKGKKIKIEDPQGLSLSEGKRIIFFFCKKKRKISRFSK